MLCQKCGRREAIVHLETVVFRQKVEEHLCRLCAGVRGTAASKGIEAFLDRAPPASIDIADLSAKAALPGGVNEKIRKLIRLSKKQGYLRRIARRQRWSKPTCGW
jgi:uncharacterized protein CbrC (UPF0167 family)